MDCFDKALKMEGKYPLTYYFKSLLLTQMGKDEEAIELIDKSISQFPHLDPNWSKDTLAGMWTDRGIYLYKQKNFPEAMHCFGKALEINPKFDPAFYYKAKILIDSENFREAYEKS